MRTGLNSQVRIFRRERKERPDPNGRIMISNRMGTTVSWMKPKNVANENVESCIPDD